MNDSAILEKFLEINFKNKDLLKEALTHRSFLNESSRETGSHNERLEFLGDAVLELVVTNLLFNEFPYKNEGELTSLRAALVNSKMLFEVAEGIKLYDYLRLSKGEAKDFFGKGRQFILANAFEALVGAIYVDLGYGEAEKFIKKYICSNLNQIVEQKLWRDPKSLFQEKAQDITGITPVYGVLKESGPDHKKFFVSGVYLDEEIVAQGEGYSKQESEAKAAENALKVKGWEE